MYVVLPVTVEECRTKIWQIPFLTSFTDIMHYFDSNNFVQRQEWQDAHFSVAVQEWQNAHFSVAVQEWQNAHFSVEKRNHKFINQSF